MELDKQPLVFLLMPFAPEFDDLRNLIVAAGERTGARVVRADDIFSGGIVIDQVKERIRNADAVIAVCTDRNANVFYELGLAEPDHRPILVASGATDLPFDIQHFRAQFYGGETSATNLETLSSRLEAAIRETLGEPRPEGLLARPSAAPIRRAAVAARAEGILRSMATYAPGDMSKLGDEMEPLLGRYLGTLIPYMDKDSGGFQEEVKQFARWTEMNLGPDQGNMIWITMPQWLVWWVAGAAGAYCVHAERWSALAILCEQTTYLHAQRYVRLSLLDAGPGGDSVGSSRFQNDLERIPNSRYPSAFGLVRALGLDPAVRSLVPDFVRQPEDVWTSLAIYRLLSALKAAQGGRPPDAWPWLYSAHRLGRFGLRMRQDPGYRRRLSEGLFGVDIKSFDGEVREWQQAVTVPAHAESRPPDLGPA